MCFRTVALTTPLCCDYVGAAAADRDTHSAYAAFKSRTDDGARHKHTVVNLANTRRSGRQHRSSEEIDVMGRDGFEGHATFGAAARRSPCVLLDVHECANIFTWTYIY